MPFPSLPTKPTFLPNLVFRVVYNCIHISYRFLIKNVFKLKIEVQLTWNWRPSTWFDIVSRINTTFVVVAMEKIIRKKYNFNLLMLFQATNIFLQAKLSVCPYVCSLYKFIVGGCNFACWLYSFVAQGTWFSQTGWQQNRYNLRGRPRLEINEGTSSSGVAIKAFLARLLVKLIIFWAVIHNSALFASYWSNLRTDL